MEGGEGRKDDHCPTSSTHHLCYICPPFNSPSTSLALRSEPLFTSSCTTLTRPDLAATWRGLGRKEGWEEGDPHCRSWYQTNHPTLGCGSRFLLRVGAVQELVATFVQNGQGAVLVSLQAGQVEGSVPVLVAMTHIQLVRRHRDRQEVWGTRRGHDTDTLGTSAQSEGDDGSYPYVNLHR